MTLVHDARTCRLGEGALWHPGRATLYWFDILAKRLLTQGAESWRFEEHVSAAGWIDATRLLVASETALLTLDLDSGAREEVCPLEADRPDTRSNDGRADPWGGFWIGTMGKAAEPDAGAIYRYYRGALRRLFAPITISNAIAFSPDRRWAYFTDTATRVIQRVALGDADGWPIGAPEVFAHAEGSPDGAVCDAAGNLWNAEWGSGRVTVYSPQGAVMRRVPLPAKHVTCPSFGGADLGTLFVTSARVGLGAADAAQGQTFAIPGMGPGLPEPRVIL